MRVSIPVDSTPFALRPLPTDEKLNADYQSCQQANTHELHNGPLFSKRIGIRGRAIVWPHAEPCMDVDKPHQLELLRADLASVQRKAVARAKSAVKRASAAKSTLTATTKKKPALAKKTTARKPTATKLKPKAKPKLQG